MRGFRADLPRSVLQLHDHGDGESCRVQDRRRAVRSRSLADAAAFVGVLNVAFAAHSGLWGVLVIDMIQFFIKMTAVIAAAYFALQAPQVGGLDGLVDEAVVDARAWRHRLPQTCCPTSRTTGTSHVAVFIMPIAVQWWAVWYPGAEPGGGSYIAQRMLASKSERDALGARAVLQRRALRAASVAVDHRRRSPRLLVYPELSDIQRAFPQLDPRLLGHDIAYPAMLKFLPAGFVGLMVGGLIAANSSTILTHLNWGASYLVHDFYRRFIRTDADERHYVMAGRLATVAAVHLLVGGWCSCSTRQRTRSTSSCRSARAPACCIWCAGSGGASTPGARSSRWSARSLVSIVFLRAREERRPRQHACRARAHNRRHDGLLGGDRVRRARRPIATCWSASTARFARPGRDGRRFARIAGVATPSAATATTSRWRWSAGWPAASSIWSALFTVGNLLYGRYSTALALFVVFAISSAILIRIVQTLWAESAARQDAVTGH